MMLLAGFDPKLECSCGSCHERFPCGNPGPFAHVAIRLLVTMCPMRDGEHWFAHSRDVTVLERACKARMLSVSVVNRWESRSFIGINAASFSRVAGSQRARLLKPRQILEWSIWRRKHPHLARLCSYRAWWNDSTSIKAQLQR